MDTLISVLLYIHALPGPGVYHSTQIQQIQQAQQSQIQAVYSNPQMLQNAIIVEAPIERQVVIISDWGTSK